MPRLPGLPRSSDDKTYGISRRNTPQKATQICARLCQLRQELQKTVVLVGMMGAGKTAVGTALARMLGVPFLDSDAEIEQAANMSIAEIFARDGEEFFRRKETQVIERLLQGRPGILSTGGGAFMREENRALIAEHGAVSD